MELHIGPLSMGESKRIAVVNTQFDAVFPTKMKQIAGSIWTPEQQCWHIPYTREAWATFQKVFEGHTIVRTFEAKPTGVALKAAATTLSEMADETNAHVDLQTKIIIRPCKEQPNRFFLNIPHDRVDWKTYVNRIENSAYHANGRFWSVPKTKELYQQFIEYFGKNMVVDKDNPAILTDAKKVYWARTNNAQNPMNTDVERQNIPPQYPRFKDKLTVFDHPTKQDYWCLNLPKMLVNTHLETVKNIQGRVWNDPLFVWDIPKTALSQQFLDTYLPNLVHWHCERKTDAAPTNPKIITSATQPTPQNIANFPIKDVNTVKFTSFPTKEYAHQHHKRFENLEDTKFTQAHAETRAYQRPEIPPNSEYFQPKQQVQNAQNFDKVRVRLATFWPGKLSVTIPYNLQWIEKIKMMSGKHWHTDHKCWTLPYSPFTIERLEKNFAGHLDIDLSDPHQPTSHLTPTSQLPQTTLINQLSQVISTNQQPSSPKNQLPLPLTNELPQPINKNLPMNWANRLVFLPTPNDGSETSPSLSFNPTSNLTIDRSQQRDKFDSDSPQYKVEITKLEEKMTLKRMATDTVKLYKNCFRQFIKYHNTIHPEDITKEQIIKYMVNRIQAGNFSETQQNNFISAIKCYYELVLGRERTYYDLQRPKMPFQLPNILSEGEIIKLFKAVSNVKHRCILLAIYSSGIRLSELTNLRIQDLREADNCMFIKGGKGRKDRLTLLSPHLLNQLKPYLAEYTPNYWLFEGQTGGKYSSRSVQKILREAVEKSGVNPFATVHTLRHSFATHLVLAGENLITVQHLLGHEDLRTTEIYIHLTGEFIRNTKSPLDRLKF